MKTLSYRGKVHQVELSEESHGQDLIREAIAITRLNPNRVRVTYEVGGKRIPVTADQLLKEIDSEKFTIKDLGPQFSYYGVFMCEYLGPFLLWGILKSIMKPEKSQYIQCATIMWSFHYAKRLFETHFVHIFSHATMPLFNLFKNCTYYWGFAAAIAYSVLRTDKELSNVQWAAFGLFFVCELLNLYCHLKLRNLRPKGSKEHVLPKGFLFNSIACPNYTMEILAWVCFAVFARVIPSYLFPICGTAQMWIWADQKRRRLIAKWPEAKKRGRITPFRAL